MKNRELPHAQVGRIVLEISLKPFKRMDEENIERVCREVLEQWYPILKIARECSILFWVADGSEILTWNGNLEGEMEWARYIGFCNAEYRPYTGHTRDPRRIAILYMENPPRITYGDLKIIIATFKKMAAEEFGLKLTAGATFDPGPEFAQSEFKFKTHPEIMRVGTETGIGRTVAMVRAWSTLKGDSSRYASYPDGIPDGTPFGEFFWKQSRNFMSALGFDYIWLSNGFGFSHFGWSALGENFDGKRFNTADYDEVSEGILEFWREYKRECSDYPVEVRGTNFSLGIDLASDCVPTLEIYEGGCLRTPPPNYPTGALNSDFGLEMVGYMSRIALLPGETFPFRYYPNDPWFWQNPWWDLYDREPFDIYCPMSVGRINDEGEVENPQVIEFLTIDTERGELDERCPLEVIPHIRRAIEDYPDEAGILTWLYPFREYHEIAARHRDRIDLPYFGDWFVRGAINAGLPLNTVLSTDDFPRVLSRNPDALANTILFTPSSILDGTYEKHLMDYIRGGGKAIFYGPLDFTPPSIRELLNVKLDEGLEGDFSLHLTLEGDKITKWRGRRTFKHDALLSGGPVREVLLDDGDEATSVCAILQQGGRERAYALTRQLPSWNGGMMGWIRGSSSFYIGGSPEADRLQPVSYPADVWNPAELVRYLLSQFGYHLRQERDMPDTKPAMTFIARHRNGYIFSGFKADTTVILHYGFPQGAPIFVGLEAEVNGGVATYFLDKSFHKECRIFVSQETRSVVSCREQPPFPTGKERKLHVSGLLDADVTIYPPLDRMDEVAIKSDGREVDLENRRENKYIHLKGISGLLDISW
ncbi:MAG: hypothetical protein ACUVXI_04205 [bacterium]